MDAQQFLNSVTALVVIGGGCALGVASLVVIAWVTWMLADAGRAVD